MSDEERKLLNIIHDESLMALFLEHLEKIGLISSFLHFENNTMQEHAYPLQTL